MRYVEKLRSHWLGKKVAQKSSIYYVSLSNNACYVQTILAYLESLGSSHYLREIDMQDDALIRNMHKL